MYVYVGYHNKKKYLKNIREENNNLIAKWYGDVKYCGLSGKLEFCL